MNAKYAATVPIGPAQHGVTASLPFLRCRRCAPPPPPGTGPIFGTPRFTLTIADGRLYARMGTPITNPVQRPGVATSGGSIVCLDLCAEGKLLWRELQRKAGAVQRRTDCQRCADVRSIAAPGYPPAGARRLFRHRDRPYGAGDGLSAQPRPPPRGNTGIHARSTDFLRGDHIRKHEPRAVGAWPRTPAGSTGCVFIRDDGAEISPVNWTCTGTVI